MSLPPDVAGDVCEQLAADRFDLDLVEDGPAWFDAYSPGGLPVDVKAARYRVSQGSSSRRGRWWFQRENHRDLVDHGGMYALLVYDDRDDAGDVAAVVVYAALVPAKFVSAIMGAWTETGPNHTGGADVTAQASWTRVFPRSGPEPATLEARDAVADSDPEDDPLASAVVEAIHALDDSGDGVPRDAVLDRVREETGASSDEAQDALHAAKMAGSCFEPEVDRLRATVPADDADGEAGDRPAVAADGGEQS